MTNNATSMECRNFSTYMRTQRNALRHAIDEDKWYLSERAGYDVGWEAAKQHFYKEFLMGFSQEYRRVFCEVQCHYTNECDLYKAHRSKTDIHAGHALI